MKNIYIHTNDDELSLKTKDRLLKLLNKNSFNVFDKFVKDVDVVIVIGGDGTFLNAIKEANYYDALILGINTGHLGFYADFTPDNLEEVIDICIKENYSIQKCKTIKVELETNNSTIILDPAVNDVFIKHGHSSIVHLDLFVGDEYIESFSGDGILISSSAGSTAYNYSLGGSIVDPRVNLLQITPVAPANNSAYRSITSSLITPANEKIVVICKDKDNTIVVLDGNENIIEDIKKITVTLSNEEIKIIRSSDYSFWNKVKSKFLQ